MITRFSFDSEPREREFVTFVVGQPYMGLTADGWRSDGHAAYSLGRAAVRWSWMRHSGETLAPAQAVAARVGASG